MKTIQEWQNEIVAAMRTKFPNSWDQKRRAEELLTDAEDTHRALQVELGEVERKSHRDDDPNERIGGMLANAFELLDQRGADIEKVLEHTLNWYKDSSKKPGQG